MNPIKYSDDLISEREIVFAIPSIIIGIAVLGLPNEIASNTLFADGWITIVVAGMILTVVTLLGTKLAATFPGESFLSYTSKIISKPIAYLFTVIFIFIFIFFSAHVLRATAYITKGYLFTRTPIEVLALALLLVVVYAVSGSRAGLFRLNILFLPIIISVFVIVSLLNIKWMNTSNLLPLFKTDLRGYAKAMVPALNAYTGFSIVLFYTAFIRKPKKLTRAIVVGMSIPLIFYVIVFFTSIGIFGNAVTSNLLYPTVETARRAEVPGGLFERVDSIFFTIWIMAIFNTLAMTMDIAVMLLHSIFKNLKKITIIFILSPIIFYLCMFPETIAQVRAFIQVINIYFVFFATLSILLLYTVAKIRGINNREKI